jgi:hypothetical protein
LLSVTFLAVSCADFFIPGDQSGGDGGQRQRADQDGQDSGGKDNAGEQGRGEESVTSGSGGAEQTSGLQGGSGGEQASAPELEEAYLSTEDSGDPVRTSAELAGQQGGDGGSAEVALRTRIDEVFAAGRHASLPDDTEFGVEWEALEVYDPEDEYGYDAEILGSESEFLSGSGSFSFSMEEAIGSGPFPPGRYKAAITVDGQVVERLPFSLYEPEPNVVASPVSDLGSQPSGSSGVTSEPTDLQFVVDGSASMTELVGDGTPKLAAAKEAIRPLISALPEGDVADNINVGLRAFGQERTDDVAASCEDTELLSPMQGIDKEGLRDQVEGLKAAGKKTPLAYTVEQAAGNFAPDNENNAIILVSDGLENCQRDAVDVVSGAAEDANLTVHVVGFDIGSEEKPEEARRELQEMAEGTGGVYVDASDPQGLTDALRRIAEEEVGVLQVRSGAGQLVLKTPDDIPPDSFDEFVLLDESGSEVVQEYGYSREQRTNTYQLPAGTYTGEFYPSSSNEPLTVRVEIGPSQESVFETGALRLRAPSDTDTVYLVDRRTGRANEGYGYSDDNFLDGPRAVPPGSYDLRLQTTGLSEPVTVAEKVEVKPGQVVEVSP